MSALPNEILSQIAGYLPTSDAIHSVVEVYDNPNGSISNAKKIAMMGELLPDELLSNIAGYLDPSHPLRSFVKSNSNEEGSKREEHYHKTSDDWGGEVLEGGVGKRFEDPANNDDGFTEEDFNIALDLLSAPMPNNSTVCFDDTVPLDSDISPVPVNKMTANSPVATQQISLGGGSLFVVSPERAAAPKQSDNERSNDLM